MRERDRVGRLLISGGSNKYNRFGKYNIREKYNFLVKSISFERYILNTYDLVW